MTRHLHGVRRGAIGVRACFIAASLIAVTRPSLAQCEPDWTGGYTSPIFSFVNAYGGTVFDDGSGPALYIHGQIGMNELGNNITRWSDQGWSKPWDGPNGQFVYATATFDDGTGLALYAGGNFTHFGAQPANGIGRWDGTSWTQVGGGISGGTNPRVRTLVVHDDGGGPALYVGGVFSEAGGIPVTNAAKWDGAVWSPIGAEFTSGVIAFFSMEGVLYGSNGRLHRWSGTEWELVEGIDGQVVDMTVHDDGTGPSLYIGGRFETAGGHIVNNIARWDGNNWAPLGQGCNDGVYALQPVEQGGGTVLWVGGEFTEAGGTAANRVATWNGAQWRAVGGGVSGGPRPIVNDICRFDGSGGREIYVIGYFERASGTRVTGVARRADGRWSGLGHGIGGLFPDRWPLALAVHDDGNGPALYAIGAFDHAGGVPVNDIGRWDGRYWTALGGGLDSVSGTRGAALAVFDDGRGAALYAAADFTTAGGQPAPGIARWDGNQWEAVGGGVSGGNAAVRALAVWNDGAGDALYAAGSFTTAGTTAAANVVRWDGLGWSALGSGLNNEARTLCVFEDGGGPALYAGGVFTQAGGAPAARVARWDGSSWSTLSAGIPGSVASVSAMAVYDEGSGPRLIVGGSFSEGSAPGANIAAWDGVAWRAMWSGLNGACGALAVGDIGEGQSLYAGGTFTQAGGLNANNIARWDGDSWGPLGAGVGQSSVTALHIFDYGAGPALYLGGDFGASGSFAAHSFARWGCPPVACDPCDANCDGAVDAFDIEPFIELLVDPNAPRCASCSGDANADGAIDAFDIEPFIACLTP